MADLPAPETSICDPSCDSEGNDQVNTSGDETSDDESGGRSDDSLDGTLEKCPICLRIFRQQEIGIPDTCEHCFCLTCITEWAENVTTCPIDRKVFHSVLILDKVKGQVIRVHELPPHVPQGDDYEDFSDPTFCEICGCCDREDRLLLCDECDDGYHLECLDPPLDEVPESDWWCSTCAAARLRALNDIENSGRNEVRQSRSRMPRTGLSRRIMRRRRRDGSSLDLSSQSIDERVVRSRRKRTSSTLTGRQSSNRRTHSDKRRRRGKKRRTKKRRVAKERKPATCRGRLIQQLGILPPRPGQVYVGLPTCRPTHPPAVEPSTSSAASIRTQRHQAGIAPLRIYSTVNDLADYFEMSSDEGSNSVGVMRPQPSRITDNRKRLLAKANAHESSSVNVLGPILSRQHIFLQDKNIQISSVDGRLVSTMSVNLDKLLHSPSNENDSSGYDSFGNRGSPPRVRRSIFQSAITTNAGNSSSTTGRETVSSDTTSTSSATTSSITSSARETTTTSGSFMLHGNSSTMNTSSGTTGSEVTGNPFDDLSGLDDMVDKCAQRKKGGNSTGSEKEEDEFNIYSDIEDDPIPITRRSRDPIVFDASGSSMMNYGILSSMTYGESSVLDSGGGGGAESDNENDMIIDEHEGDGEPERHKCNDPPPSSLNFPQNKDGTDDLSENGSESLPGDVEPDSPLSIPLPDSTPPPSVRGGAGVDDEDSRELGSPDEAGKGDGIKVQPKEEYDPCHPLTSSDDEEVPLPHSEPITSTAEGRSPLKGPSTSQVSLSPLPLPTNDDCRRPAIQFSIPSRHRIFSMGSLIRRNKGVMKKEMKAGSSISFQSEMSKGFEPKTEEDEVETTGSGLDGEKISLVAEIFGSDEDDGVDIPVEMESNLIPKSPELQNEVVSVVESTTDTLSSEVVGKWKKIEEDDEVIPPLISSMSPPQRPIVENLENDEEVMVIGESPPEVQIIETPPPEPEDQIVVERNNKQENISNVENKTETDELKENDTTSHASAPPPYRDSSSQSEDEFERQRLRERRMNNSKKQEEEKRVNKIKKGQKKDKVTRRLRKRSRSPSAESNREEGEILDIPDKKKKRSKKSKKSKKRRRSSRSRSTSSSSDVVSFTEKKIPEDVHGQVQVSDEENVRWKKPSKSTKQRNYRDGKPKTEERYFREREKKLENESFSNRGGDNEKSPFVRHTTSQEEMRREKGRSRSKEQEHRSGRQRSRDRRRRTHSKHSNRSSSSLRNYRSRSKSVGSRSSKSRLGRHHRDHSVSPGQSHTRSSPLQADSSRSHHHRSRSASKRQNRKRSRSDRRMRQSTSRSRSISPRRKKTVPMETKKSKKDTSDRKIEEKIEIDTVVAVPETTTTERTSTNVEKEKRKKKKRREKSISPAKAIFADGDSIVVSLNFQKGRDSAEKDNSATAESGRTLESKDKKSSRIQSNSKDKGKMKSIKKTVLIDLESSPIQEQNIGISPTLIVLSDDEEHGKGNESDTDRVAVSTTSTGEEPVYRDRDCHGVPADSTLQLHPTEDSVGRHSTVDSDAATTPARGDALVTSTRDSMDRTGTAQDEYPISPCTPPKDTSPQYNNTPPLPPGSPPTTGPTVSSHHAHSPEHPKQNLSSVIGTISNVVPPLVPTIARPMGTIGLGSIPGIFPSSGSRLPTFSSATSNPTQLPVPNQPIPQLRHPAQNLFNQSVLATVANALYGPLMAPQSLFAVGPPPATAGTTSSRMPTNVIAAKKPTVTAGSVLVQKDQNFSTQKRTEGGDSPFSPNSSDGDDLFEPPKDSGHHTSGSKSGGSGGASIHRGDKGPPTESGEAGGAMGKKGRTASRIFDTLFGGPIRKPPGTPTKPEAVKSSKSPQKSKSKKGNHRKPTGTMSEGELRLSEDVPTSAVELRVKEKFLKKLNRQERVVEEVKVSLKPHYSKKHITKEEYKDILRRAVPKICHNKTGEINPIRIKELVEAYVKKIRKTKKK